MANVTNVATTTTMAALVPIAGTTVFLNQEGREGLFECTPGAAQSDPQQGLYVASNTSGFYWARVWDGITGPPEWFGAKSGDGTFDNRTALNSCLALCPVMQLGAFDYFINGTWSITQANRTIKGVYGTSFDSGNGTRIILTGTAVASAEIARFGVVGALPVTTGECIRDIVCQDVSFVRDSVGGAVIPPSSGLPQDAVRGVVTWGLIDGRFVRVKSIDSPIGFHAYGTIGTDFVDCTWFRRRAGSAPVNDVAVGFQIGGGNAQTQWSIIGANASVRVVRPTCSVQGTFVEPTGIRLWGYCGDTFIDDAEIANCAFGVRVDGRVDGTNVPQEQSAHQDIRINHIVADVCSSSGILLQYLNVGGAVRIVDPYVAPVNRGAGIQLLQVKGLTSLVGGIVLGAPDTRGFLAENSSNFTVTGFTIRDAGQSIIIGCSSFQYEPVVNNPFTIFNGPALIVNGCARSRIAPVINGRAGAWTSGIASDSQTNFVEFNGSAVNQGAFTTPSAALKVTFGGSDANANAAFNAAGNRLLGVTG